MKQSGYFITKLIGNGYETSLIEKGDMNERDN
jgi:hypothetical protein